ncbi:NAD-dependent epimerase/dehydratase family protein [Aureimonas leprariae]|uniref:NAD-dependent epimerase/dehydratase family protein n=1 Tax=Plantimonas leprariae TaxID=2615207 RepID=A0A7V7PKH8_9HYPH|nr:NAD-dependent epimerase/dehydratase family protein [Aureimonas leprariae]KAB0676304.1 NAD-dependent epimerase/dehydratase family protein [Aureimonas leprariae]
MHVFLTGATGFIGSHLVTELVGTGHRVTGLSRSDAGIAALARAGADAVRGDVNDLPFLRAAAEAADAVVHAAFDHDHADMRRHSENDRRVVETLGAALAGSDRPLVVTSGTGLVRSGNGGPALETDGHLSSAEFPRAATEEAADALIAAGRHVMVVRLPQVHDTHRQGRITWQIQLAREQGSVAYVGGGANRVSAVHVGDAARLYGLVLASGRAGARYHAVAEEGVAMRDVAAAIGVRLGLPVASIDPGEAQAYFGWMAPLAAADLAASGASTRRELRWDPFGPDLLTDLRAQEPLVR